MFKYETHLHTSPVSSCGRSTPEEMLVFFKNLGYDGVFVTNHFIDGNIGCDRDLSYEEMINFYFSDYEKAKSLEKNIGIKVFGGVEMSYKGTDFLVYGLDKEWFLAHGEITDMKKSEELPFLRDNGALVIQAHPFREAGYIDHIRLFPRCVEGFEIINACRTDFENEMARLYAEKYDLLPFAGSDIHLADDCPLAGVESEKEINSVSEFIEAFRAGKLNVFYTPKTEE